MSNISSDLMTKGMSLVSVLETRGKRREIEWQKGAFDPAAIVPCTNGTESFINDGAINGWKTDGHLSGLDRGNEQDRWSGD